MAALPRAAMAALPDLSRRSSDIPSARLRLVLLSPPSLRTMRSAIRAAMPMIRRQEPATIRNAAHSQMPSATRPNASAKQSSIRTRQAANRATPSSPAPMPIRLASALSSSLARSSSYLTSCEMSLAATETRSPMDWSVALDGARLTAGSAMRTFLSPRLSRRCHLKVLLMPNGNRSRHPYFAITLRGRDSQSSGFPGPRAASMSELPRQKTAPQDWGAVVRHVKPGYQACTLTAVVGRIRSAPPSLWRTCDHYSPATARLPRLVARGYPAAVYGPAVRDSFLLGFRSFEKTAARSIRYLNRSRQFHVTASRSVAAVLPISGRTGREHSTPVRRNVNSGHLRARATRRSERSGFTTCGWPTSSRSGRSVT